ncbi:monooxygenase [Psychrobacter sp. DM8]|uniref:monooxygenase n=1 Tax=Psychrobacter sp. DM8 TaxID=3440636 RepID=UPI003F503917
MQYLLQMDFPYSGPFGDEFYTQMKDLASDIATESGLVYKLWTENADTQEAGGIYVFDNLEDANRYLTKHTERLESFGITGIRAKTFIINKELSAITKASV